jgi:hypothetical protein
VLFLLRCGLKILSSTPLSSSACHQNIIKCPGFWFLRNGIAIYVFIETESEKKMSPWDLACHCELTECTEVVGSHGCKGCTSMLL